MSMRHLSVLAFLALAACPNMRTVISPIPVPEPPEAEEALLRAGAYEVRIEGVASMVCPGLAPRELVGQALSGELRVGEEEVVLSLSGLALRGEMIPGALFVEGSVASGGSEPEPVRETEDVASGDADAAGGSGAGERASCAPEDVETPEECGGGRPDGGPARAEVYAALDARIVDAGLAEGRLTVLQPDCAMELEVRVVRGEGPAPVEDRGEERPGDEGAGEEDRPDGDDTVSRG